MIAVLLEAGRTPSPGSVANTNGRRYSDSSPPAGGHPRFTVDGDQLPQRLRGTGRRATQGIAIRRAEVSHPSGIGLGDGTRRSTRPAIGRPLAPRKLPARNAAQLRTDPARSGRRAVTARIVPTPARRCRSIDTMWSVWISAETRVGQISLRRVPRRLHRVRRARNRELARRRSVMSRLYNRVAIGFLDRQKVVRTTSHSTARPRTSTVTCWPSVDARGGVDQRERNTEFSTSEKMCPRW